MECTCSSPACVIFDVDGTLTQTNELIFASFNYLAEKYVGRRFSPEEIVALFGPPEEGALRKVFGPEGLESKMEELLDFYTSHHRSLASLHAGIRELLGYLKGRGIRLAVFTGKGRRTTMITLRALEIEEFFDLVVSGNDVIHHKPDPEGILLVLRALGLRPEQALMVGDSLSDIRASRAAGVPIASVVWDAYDRATVQRENPGCCFQSVEEIFAWFRKNLNGTGA
jgi:pyrophosphatase PpaX